MILNGNGPALSAVCVTLSVISVLLVLLRCYVRVYLVRAFRYDDWLLIVALLCFILQSAFAMSAVHYGLGEFVLTLSTHRRIRSTQMTILFELVYIWTTTFVKASIGASLLRLTQKKLWIYILSTALTIDVVLGAIIFAIQLFSCDPVEYRWTQFDPTTSGVCKLEKSFNIVAYVLLGTTCAIYLLFATLPIFMLWNVQVNLRTKASVLFILSLGIISMVANMVRLKYLGPSLLGPNAAFIIVQDLIWSTLECGLGMITSCVATYTPLLQLLRRRGASSDDREIDDFKRYMDLDEIFGNGVHTTIQGNATLHNNASRENILGNDIHRLVEITVKESRMGESVWSCDSERSGK